MTELQSDNRIINPFAHLWVICKEIIILGNVYNFGDQVNIGLDLHNKHTHFYNGALGTIEELESLGGKPVATIEPNNTIMPIAVFTQGISKEKVAQGDVDLEPFYIENLELLRAGDKDDLLGYAEACGINIPVPKSNAKKETIIKNIIAKAKELDLVQEK